MLITVLVLELRPPERPVFEALLERWPTWLSYAVSYLFTSNRRRRVWQTTVWRHGKIGFGRNSRRSSSRTFLANAFGVAQFAEWSERDERHGRARAGLALVTRLGAIERGQQTSFKLRLI